MFTTTTKMYVALLSVSFFWGTSFAATKISLVDLTPLNLVGFRFSIVSLIFALILLSMRGKNAIDRRDIPKFFLLGFLAIASYFYIQFTALQFTTTINCSLIIATSPIFIGIFGKLLGWEDLNIYQLGGILTAFSGVIAIITNGNLAHIATTNTFKGDIMMLSNAIVWAGFTLYGKNILQKYSPFVAMAYIHICGTLIMLPFALIPNPLSPITLQSQLGQISSTTFAAILYLALLCSIYSYFIWYTAVSKIGAVRTGVFTYFNPLIAIITGVFLMKETLSAYTFIGGLLIILGVYITNKTKSVPLPMTVSYSTKEKA